MTDDAFREMLRTHPPQKLRDAGIETYWRWGDLFVRLHELRRRPGQAREQRWRYSSKADDPVMMRRAS